MFSIDFPEIIIIFGVALVVLGPKKLPGAAAKIGRWVGRARSMARQFREQLEQEVASAENAIDIRDSVDSTEKPARQQPPKDSAAAEQAESATPHGSFQAPLGEGLPAGAVAHGPSEHAQAAYDPAARDSAAPDAVPYEPTPYHSSMPEHPMPPPEGYGPAPQQLSFDQQLHDTALPADGVASGASAAQYGRAAAAEAESSPSDPREWMPETQTWMAGAGWEVPESSEREATGSSTGTSTGSGTGSGPVSSPRSNTTSGGAPELDEAAQTQRSEPIERHDR